MKLAEGGLPKGGGVGYEIFDKSDALGTTSFVQNINHLRALEGELARTIRAIDRVQAARVHLVLPERPLFSRETPEPSASIVVRVRGALEPQQVRAIRHLVASAVNGLKPQRVSIVDEAGSLLADGAADGRRQRRSATSAAAAFEKRLRKQVEDIVSSVVGPGRARVQLSADFDYNRSPQTSDKFDPEGRVLRSSQTPRGILRHRRQQRPGHRQQRVARRSSATTAPPAARDQSKKTEEINNYEISRTTKTEVTEAGRVNRISVAVLVDGIYAKNDKGETGLPGPHARKSSTASPRWCARRSASTRSAATRSRSSICASPSRPPSPPIAEPTGLSQHVPVHQGRHHVRHRARRDDAARPRRAVHGDPAAGQAHPRARGRRRLCRRRAGAGRRAVEGARPAWPRRCCPAGSRQP